MDTKQPVTVGQMIDSLSKFNRDLPFEIAISQYNKRFPVAYVKPDCSSFDKNQFATNVKGDVVRISVYLPVDDDKKTFMFTSTKKMPL